jgi:methionyl-tRNA synthetase
MIDASCARCGDEPTTFRATVPVLDMEQHGAVLTAMWLRTELSGAVRGLINHHLTQGLPEIPVAYPTNWGIEGTGLLTGLRIDPYVEIALTDLYGIARAIDPDASTLDEFVAV